ncbi:Uncharacterised protein [Pseudomonas aeruginosa]|nr:Uncharacterised protein [Pseudomonas aeruginosa]
MFQPSVPLGWPMADLEASLQAEQARARDPRAALGALRQRLAAQERAVEPGAGLASFELGKMVGVVDQGELGVPAGMGEHRMFPGLGEMVVLAGEHQGRAGRVPLEAAEGQQAPAILPVAFDLRRGQALQLAQHGLAKYRGDAGTFQL